MRKALKLSGEPRTNPPVDPARTLEAQASLTPEVAAILDRACMDCHSHKKRWPWYSHVMPVSIFVAGHVNHGRKHLNFSDWTQQGGHRRKGARPEEQFQRICEVLEKRQMPLGSYLLLHRRCEAVGRGCEGRL